MVAPFGHLHLGAAGGAVNRALREVRWNLSEHLTFFRDEGSGNLLRSRLRKNHSRFPFFLLYPLSLDDFDNLTAFIDVVKVLKVIDDVIFRLGIYKVQCLAGISSVRIEAPANGYSPDLVQTPKELFSLAGLWATDKVEFLH